MTAEEELDDFVMPGDAERDAYVVTDVPHANKLVRRLRRLSADLRRFRDEADEERKRIDRWLEDRSAGTEHDVEWIEGQLKGFLAAIIKEDPEGHKTLKLLGATVKANPTGGLKGAHVRDRDAYSEWAAQHGLIAMDAPVKVPYDLLAAAEVLLRTGSNFDGVDRTTWLHIADEIHRALDEQAKLKLPPGLKPTDPEGLRSGEESPVYDPSTSEVLPGVVAPPIGFNYVVTVEEA